MYIRPQCHKLKREQNHVARCLSKKPSRHKHIVCHYCGSFSHLRPHCSKFHALKRIKRKEKLELLGSCAKKGKPVLSENSMLLNKMLNAFNSLSICISSYHSSNPRLTTHETSKQSFRLESFVISIWLLCTFFGGEILFLVNICRGKDIP